MATEGGVLELGWSGRALDRPVSRWWCAAAWGLATVLFVTWISLIGGPTPADASQSTVEVLALARGQFNCVYPADQHTPTPPLYPLVAAAVVAATGIDGPRIPSPSWPLGPHCENGLNIMDQISASHQTEVEWVGMIGWLVLLGGFVALLRAVGRGRSLWECAGVVVLACLVPVFECIASTFHPNDLMAMGLVLGAMACCVRARWGAAGALIGLACMTHQYALLAAVPLAVLTLAERRFRFVVWAGVTAAAVLGITVALAGWSVLRSVVGEGIVPTSAATWVDKLGLGNDGLAVLSRIVPLVLAGVLGLIAARRLGREAWSPPLLCSLMASCIGFRLVFEINLIGYRFAAYAVMLLALDCVVHRVRLLTFGWLIAVSFIFPWWGFFNATWLGEQEVPIQVLLVVWYYAAAAAPWVRSVAGGAVPAVRLGEPG